MAVELLPEVPRRGAATGLELLIGPQRRFCTLQLQPCDAPLKTHTRTQV